MKRTLTFWLLLAMAASAVAQTPTVVEKPSQVASAASKPAPKTSATAKPSSQSSSKKPSPATVKVDPAPAQKTPGQTKPAVVAVQPANARVVAAPATKPAAVAAGKGMPVPASKMNMAAAPAAKIPAPSAAKVVAVPVVKPSAPPMVKPVVAVKPMQSVPVPGKPTVAVSPKAGVVAVKVGAPAVQAAGKDPFNKNAPKAGLVKAQPQVAAGAAVVAVKDDKVADDKKPVVRKVDAAGRRDPFVSPVVTLGAMGSGCSTGKRCLAIDQIALRGVVKSDSGMIAVVVNAMDKAYFLRENDPVFDGYVVKITGDSIVFKETFRDKLGKPLTKDVTKTISRPVA